jgi:DNA repair exonuclease SbcCD ATPase subunit
MNIKSILSALKGDAGDESLSLWLQVKDKISEAENAITETRRELDLALIDDTATLAEVTEKAAAARERESAIEARLERLRAREAKLREGIFSAANTAWSSFIRLKWDSERIAREIALTQLEPLELPAHLRDRAASASKFVQAEAALAVNLTAPGVDLVGFLEGTLPQIPHLKPQLEARLKWWQSLQAGKIAFEDGPPPVTGAGAVAARATRKYHKDAPEAPTATQSDAQLLETMPEHALAARRKKQRRKKQAEGSAPADWQGEAAFETKPVKAL